MKLEIKNYTKKIKNEIVLDNINIEFNSNKIYLLKGHNGSGKTMLLRALAGLIRPTEGTVISNNKILKENEFLNDAGVLIGHTELLKAYTALDNLKFINNYKNVMSENDLKQILISVGLEEQIDKRVSSFSLGMNQKLSIAQAFIGDPKILLLDEPFNSLDKKTCEKISNLLVRYKSDAIIIVAAHNFIELEKLADEIIELDMGKVIE